MALDNAALLEVLEAMQAAGVEDRRVDDEVGGHRATVSET